MPYQVNNHHFPPGENGKSFILIGGKTTFGYKAKITKNKVFQGEFFLLRSHSEERHFYNVLNYRQEFQKNKSEKLYKFDQGY